MKRLPLSDPNLLFKSGCSPPATLIHSFPPVCISFKTHLMVLRCPLSLLICLVFFFWFNMGSCCVAQASLKLLSSIDPSTSDSQVLGLVIQPQAQLENSIFYSTEQGREALGKSKGADGNPDKGSAGLAYQSQGWHQIFHHFTT